MFRKGLVVYSYLLLAPSLSLSVVAAATHHRHLFHSFLITTTPQSSQSSQSSSALSLSSTKESHNNNINNDHRDNDMTYKKARDIRLKHGHDAAVPLYQKLLSNNVDVTAASRIGAAKSSPWRHDQACPVPSFQNENGIISSDSENKRKNKRNNNNDDLDDEIRDAIQKLRQVLIKSNFDNGNVQKLFGIDPSKLASTSTSTSTSSLNEYTKEKMLTFAQCPIYLRPISAGTQSKLPSLLDNMNIGDTHTRTRTCTRSTSTSDSKDTAIDPLSFVDVSDNSDDNDKNQKGDIDLSSLKCIVSLFLLGFAVPKEMLSKYLIGGEETISLMEYLGLIFPCEIDPSIMVPYVHLFPLDVDIVESKNTNPEDILTNASTSTNINTKSETETILKEHDIPQKQTSSIILVTDCHPTVLSRTTVGKMEDGAVMYIGPDSLALVQHIPLQLHVTSLGNQSHNNNDNDNDGSNSGNFRILDFCTGSGIQAISTLVSLKCCKPNAKATFVDVNNRALRFTRFNAMLNGIEEERISTINTDINSGNGVVFTATKCDEMSNRIESASMDEEEELFDIILANPPFIPVPDAFENIPSDGRSKNNDESLTDIIEKRYGLFSSGGSSGEDVLRSIISMSPKLLRPGSGFLGIVSEFMNPPGGEVGLELLEKIQKWWKVPIISDDKKKQLIGHHGNGVLLTNEFPVTAATYAARRADNQFEFNAWSNHLDACQIRSVSPGLLFVRLSKCYNDNDDDDCSLKLMSHQVPKTNFGSIWTPYNIKAVQSTKRVWKEIMQ